MSVYRDTLVKLFNTQLLQSPRFGAEVGVHRGATAHRLLHEFPQLHLYLVDTWGPPSESWAATSDTLARASEEDRDRFYADTVKRMQPFPTRAEILKMDSVEAVQYMQPLDFAFVDSDHSPTGCKRELDAYWPLIRPSGILCGHDFGKDDTPGVEKAVREFVATTKTELHIEDGNIWWIRKS